MSDGIQERESSSPPTGGIAAALPLPDIDTDTIIPIEYCINRERPHFDEALFRRWRFDDDGREREDFVLNHPATRRARVLVAGNNFGCGSSREMAVWALADFGIRCVVAPGFGEIFYNNCFQNGVLAALVSAPDGARLLAQVAAAPGSDIEIDIAARTLSGLHIDTTGFELDDLRADMLLQGLDPIAATLTREADIAAFEARDAEARPWAMPLSPDPRAS